MNEHTVNLNNAECLQTMTNWGETVVYNICSGTSSTVPWGTMDYAGAVSLIGIFVFLFLMLLAMLKMMFFD